MNPKTIQGYYPDELSHCYDFGRLAASIAT